MPEETNHPALKDVSKSIEASYNELHTLIEKIADIDHVIQRIRESSEEVRSQYTDILDNTKLKQAQKDYENTVSSMEKSLNKIEDGMLKVQTIRRIAEDDLKGVLNKIQRFEGLLDSLNSRSKALDKKLTQSMETLKLNHANVTKKADKALKLVELNYHADKYDEILKLQKENNELLKKLRPAKKPKSKQPEKPIQKNNHNTSK